MNTSPRDARIGLTLTARLALAQAEQDSAVQDRLASNGHGGACFAFTTLDADDCDCYLSTPQHRAESGFLALDGWALTGVLIGLAFALVMWLGVA